MMCKATNKSSDITFEKIAPLFHLPIAEAAKVLCVCPTLLKNSCRELGIQKWPHRQIKSLTNMIEKLEKAQPAPEDQESLKMIIIDLQQKKSLILQDPRVYHEPLYQERKEFRAIYKKYTRSVTARTSSPVSKISNFTFVTKFDSRPSNPVNTNIGDPLAIPVQSNETLTSHTSERVMLSLPSHHRLACNGISTHQIKSFEHPTTPLQGNQSKLEIMEPPVNVAPDNNLPFRL